MKYRTITLFAICMALALQCSTIYAQDSESNLAGFISADLGLFTIKFPEAAPSSDALGEETGFDDVYGSKSGLGFGGEVGLGHAQMGLFAIIRYKYWKKTGTPVAIGDPDIDWDIDMKWAQEFVSVGARYFFIPKTQKKNPVMPFIGLGIIYSSATEQMNGSATYQNQTQSVFDKVDIDGTGFYGEVGVDFYVSPKSSIRFFAEYSSLNLGLKDEGTRYEIDGGGGVFIGASLNQFFGTSMIN
ncbi:MAG: outer membrane beta-barrel protein [Candidatus Zixiibacteriota bacterium]